MPSAWAKTREMIFGATAEVRHHHRRHAELQRAYHTVVEATGSPASSSTAAAGQQRRDAGFVAAKRHFQHIPDILADLEFYFAITGLGLSDHLLSVLLLPLTLLLRGRRCELCDVVTLGVLMACLGSYWAAGAVTTQLYSYLYHAVRRTSFVKLVMIFGIVDVADKILASLSQDALEVLYAAVEDEYVYRRHRSCHSSASFGASTAKEGGTRVRRLSLSQVSQLGSSAAVGGGEHVPAPADASSIPAGPPSRWLLLGSAFAACASTSLHSLSLLLHVVTLNVAINAEGNSLLALLVSNNFAELKSVVFKKNTAESLHAVCAVDALERMQYVVFFLVMLLHHTHERLSDFALADVLIILVVEVAIDFVKHLFVSRFNGVPPSVFRSFAQLTLLDLSAETVLWRLPPLSVISSDGAGREAQAQEAAELLTPSAGFAPRHVKRAGFDTIAYAALLLWSCGRAGGYLLVQAPLIPLLIAATLVVLKLTISTIIYGICARFTLRTLVAVPPTWAGPSMPTAADAARPLDASTSVRLGVSPVGTPHATPANSWATLSMPTIGAGGGRNNTSGGGGGAARTVVRLSPMLMALLKVDRFDLQAGKAKRVY